MSIRYDEKGKFFTQVISKDPYPVIIQTLMHRIEGNIYVRHDERIKDAINAETHFIAVTDVDIYNSQGKKVYQSDFTLVNGDHIVWMIPDKKS
jgi:hypothetical protein